MGREEKSRVKRGGRRKFEKRGATIDLGGFLQRNGEKEGEGALSFNKKEEEEEIDSLFLLPIHSITSLPPFLLAAPKKAAARRSKEEGGGELGRTATIWAGVFASARISTVPLVANISQKKAE